MCGVIYLYRIITVEKKKENLAGLRDDVNNRIKRLEEDGIEVINVNIMEGKMWEYPNHYDSFVAVITYKHNKK